MNGTSAIGNGANGISVDGAHNILGGTGPGEKNLLSGNFGNGITFHGSSFNNEVIGNYIGTDITGQSAIPNENNGIFAEAGSTHNIIHNNVIAGNTLASIALYAGADSTTIYANKIGVAVTGGSLNGLQGRGITIGSSGNTIGGLNAANEGNIIANLSTSIVIDSGMHNRILGNSIYNCGNMGIIFGNTSLPIPNDPLDIDTGVNGYQNYPVITNVTLISDSTVNISGTFNSTPNSEFRVEFFSSPTPATSLYCSGKYFMGYIMLNTDNNGDANFSLTNMDANLSSGVISATATDSTGNTSEFARGVCYPDSCVEGPDGGGKPTIENTSSLVTDTTATFIANIINIGSGQITSRGMFYLLAPYAPEILNNNFTHVLQTARDTTPGAGPFSETVTGLTCNTSYYFIAFASNTIGGVNQKVAVNGLFPFTTNACNSDSASLVQTIWSDLISVYPNPTSGVLHVALTGEKTLLTVTNLLGQTMFSKSSTAKHQAIELSEFASGTYLLTVTTEKGSIIKKVIKQ